MFPGLVLLAIGCTTPAPQRVPKAKTPVGTNTVALKVLTRKKGNTTQFLVENDELCEVTMSFDMDLVNLKPNVPLPLTASFPPGQVTEAFSVTPEHPEAKWSFSYTSSFKLGSQVRHDDRCIYELPYEPGASVEVSQGYDGHFSHQGDNKYAIDWQMPVGTLVRAARGGLVVRTKDDSDRGGGSIAFDPDNNYVLIRHDDGTLGQYCHLQKGGVTVKPGQRVVTGEAIAHSGNTGFSTGPHLHFSVFMARNGHERESIPVKFHTAEGPALTLLAGHAYQAPSVGIAATIKAPPAAPITLATGAGAGGAR